jgi:hypothetical protein
MSFAAPLAPAHVAAPPPCAAWGIHVPVSPALLADGAGRPLWERLLLSPGYGGAGSAARETSAIARTRAAAHREWAAAERARWAAAATANGAGAEPSAARVNPYAVSGAPAAFYDTARNRFAAALSVVSLSVAAGYMGIATVAGSHVAARGGG